MRISPNDFPVTETSRNWNSGIGLLATLAIALAGFASTSYASTITTVPAGLLPGDTYRLVFVTSDSYTATDSNIADYNAEVSSEANNVTALQDLETTWSVIGSTASVNAITNIVEDAGVNIYNLAGQLVADDATTNGDGLFSGSIINPIDINEFGQNTFQEVWTGSEADGQADPNSSLGDTSAEIGSPTFTNQDWLDIGTVVSTQTLQQDRLYVITGVITVGPSTPEPATTGTMILGVAVLYLAARRRQRIRRAN